MKRTQKRAMEQVTDCRGIYGRKYNPQSIPHDLLTHINYAFANVNKDSGEVVLSDTWADVEVSPAVFSWSTWGR